jgi:hypothetical protein
VTVTPLLFVTTALAAPCDAQVARIDSLPPADVARAATSLAACDTTLVDANFLRLVKRATDEDALVALFLAAIDAEATGAVGPALAKLPSRVTTEDGTEYDLRDAVSMRIGEACADHPRVAPYLTTTHTALKNVEFQQWDDAWVACTDPALQAYATRAVLATPASSYEERYASLVAMFVKKSGPAALPTLGEAAVKAAKDGGPFDALLEAMSKAGRGEAGRAALTGVLVDVARQVDTPRAQRIGFALADSGAEAAAGSLVPTLYKDRAQADGTFVYGLAAVEAGVCGGTKTAVIHGALGTEPGKAWSVVRAAETPLRAAKPRLGKACTDVTAPWPVFATLEPLRNEGELGGWLETLEQSWVKDGYTVKIQREKPVPL